MRILLAVVLALLCCTSSQAQLQLEGRYALGTPIVAVAADAIPKGSRVAYDWQADSKGCSVVPLGDGRTAHVWACPGNHNLDLVVAIATDDGISVERYDADFVVGGTVPPVPHDDSLADLVSAETATVLAEFHADWSAAVTSGTLTTRANFDKAYQSTRAGLQLSDTSQAYIVIDERLNAIAGVGDELAAELTAIAGEFGGEPSPPETGARVALIVHETADDSPEFAGELIKLRTGTEAKYLKDKGHRLYVLDDDMTDKDGKQPEILTRYATELKATGLPALLVIDPNTEKLLSARRLGDKTTAANVTEYIRQAGG